jgi:YD repeat-containing protein
VEHIRWTDHDALDRATQVNAPFNVILTFAYDAVGNRTLVRDSFGGRQTSIYDAANHLTRHSQSGNGAAASLTYDAVYNAADQLVTETRYRSNASLTTTFRTGMTSSTYDSAGRVSVIQHAMGAATLTTINTATYAYDSANRLTNELNTGTTPKTFTYDALNQHAPAALETHLTSATRPPTPGGTVQRRLRFRWSACCRGP